MDGFSLRDVSTGYGAEPVVHNIDIDIPAHSITTLIGPNGCGKSTLLKSMCALLSHSGHIMLDDREISDIPRRERARQLTLLPQSPIAPDGLTVEQLIRRGRHPYQSFLSTWSAEDDEAVKKAVRITHLEDLLRRPVGALSGGQRQRVWIAMTLAQDAGTMLLDEPTTYLDLAHSVDVLRLVKQLRDEEQRTIVMVLHDLNLAARYSDLLVVMGPHGRIAAAGTPSEVLTKEVLETNFGLSAVVIADPISGGPLVVPL